MLGPYSRAISALSARADFVETPKELAGNVHDLFVTVLRGTLFRVYQRGTIHLGEIAVWESETVFRVI